MLKEIPKIVCPVCGQEYIPSEIYVPDAFFGKQKEVVRDQAGKVEFFIGDDMSLEEEYICDHCNTPLKIKANISFDVVANPVEEEEYITTFEKPKKLKLVEEELF